MLRFHINRKKTNDHSYLKNIIPCLMFLKWFDLKAIRHDKKKLLNQIIQTKYETMIFKLLLLRHSGLQ